MKEDQYEDEDNNDSSGYDGRRYYFKVVSPIMDRLLAVQTHAHEDNNLFLWVRHIEAVRGMTASYHDSKRSAALREHIKDIRKSLDSRRRLTVKVPVDIQRAWFLDKEAELDECTAELFFLNKKLMLPVKEDDDSDFEEKDFEGKSST